MGYDISSLCRLPIDDAVEYYVFDIGGGWKGDTHEAFTRNFRILAERFGPEAVLVRGFTPAHITDEVIERYFGPHGKDLGHLMPALLITDSHPDHLTEDSLRLVISLRHAETEFGNLEAFLDALVLFVRDGDETLLKRFSEREKRFDAANEIIDLKPNFFGVGININALIERIRLRKQKREF